MHTHPYPAGYTTPPCCPPHRASASHWPCDQSDAPATTRDSYFPDLVYVCVRHRDIVWTRIFNGKRAPVGDPRHDPGRQPTKGSPLVGCLAVLPETSHVLVHIYPVFDVVWPTDGRPTDQTTTVRPPTTVRLSVFHRCCTTSWVNACRHRSNSFTQSGLGEP